MNIIIWLVVGGISGWLASRVVRGYDLGLVKNIILGIVGSFVGDWLFNQFGIVPPGGLLGTISVAFCGAAMLLILAQVLVRVLRK